MVVDGFLNFFNEYVDFTYSDNPYEDFLSCLGGKQFGNGIFNTFSHQNVLKWNNIVADAYPMLRDKFKLFGYDWLGRCFGIDLRSASNNILMFEIGTGDVLRIPCSFEDFLNNEIPKYPDACLAQSFFEEWMKNLERQLVYGRCAGYKVPLFLGGADETSNLEDSDMEIYWSVMTQVKLSI